MCLVERQPSRLYCQPMEVPEIPQEAYEPPIPDTIFARLKRPFEQYQRILIYIGIIVFLLTIWTIFAELFFPTQVSKEMLSTPNVLTPDFDMTVPPAQDRRKRELTRPEDNLLIKFTYAYAKKSGYESCWVCNKLNQGSSVIPTLAVPLNLTSLPVNKSVVASLIIKLTRSLIMPKTNHTIQVTNLAYPPLWCFKSVKSLTPPSSICRQSLFNITLDVDDLEVLENDLQEKAMTIGKDKQTSDVDPVAIAAYNFEYLSLALSRLNFKPYYLMPGNGTYICCGTLCHTWINTDIKTWCYLAWVVPLQRVQGDTMDLGTPHPRYSLNFAKRELFSKGDMAWSWFPSSTGWGIEMMKRLNKYVVLMDEIVNITSTDIQLLNVELREIRKEQLYQKLAIEQIQAVLNGICEMTMKYECCTYIKNTTEDAPDYYEVIQNHQKKVSQLQDQARRIAEEGWNPFKGFGAFGAWFGSVLSVISSVGSLILTGALILLICFLVYKLVICLWPICRKALKPDKQAPDEGSLELKSPSEYKALMI